MKIVHFCGTSTEVQWGNNAGSPNLLSHNDTVIRNFITSANTINASGNIIDPINGGELHYINSNGNSAAVRLVSEFNSNEFLNPSLVFSGWTLGSLFPDPSTTNNLSLDFISNLFFIGLNDDVLKNDANGDYFEISLSAYTRHASTGLPSVIKANGIINTDAGSVTIGFMFFNKTTNEFDLFNGYAMWVIGTGYDASTVQVPVARCLTTKSLNTSAGIDRRTINDGVLIYDANDTGTPYYMRNGVIDGDFLSLEVNNSGFRSFISDNGNGLTSEVYEFNSLPSTVPSNYILVPHIKSVNTFGASVKQMEFYYS